MNIIYTNRRDVYHIFVSIQAPLPAEGDEMAAFFLADNGIRSFLQTLHLMIFFIGSRCRCIQNAQNYFLNMQR